MLKKEDKKSKDAARSSSAPEPQLQELESQLREHVHSVLRIPKTGEEWNRAHCCGGVTYIILGVFAILLAIIEIIVSALGAATERYYTELQSGRLVSMIVLAVAAVVTIGIIVYGIVGVKKMHSKPLHTATIVLLVLAIVQAIIAGISIHITELDELGIGRSLSDSFYRAKEGDLAQKQLWDTIQSELQCCGLYSAEDYRDPYGPINFPADIPASCCPSYHSPNATMEKKREICRAHESFYTAGCKPFVIEIVKGASKTVLIVTALLIIFEIIIAILGGILSKKRKVEKHDHIEFTPTSPKPADIPQPA